VAARADGEPLVVRDRPAHDRLDVRRVERLRHRARQHVVEAGVPRPPRSAVSGLSGAEQRSAQRAVELVEPAGGTGLRRPAQGERGACAEKAPAPHDEVAPAVSLHGAERRAQRSIAR
jgi:hypothetical protein